MKQRYCLNAIALLLLVACLACIPACTKSADANSAATVSDASTTTLHFKVSGMHCGACAEAIQSKVASLEGVTGCQASFEQGSADVDVTDPALQQKIVAAITDLGYGVDQAATQTP